MKKILFSLAAVAAMVGCAKDAPIVDNTNNTPEETLAISASIDLSDTRVTIEGEEFTDVKWAQGDRVYLTSVAGVKAELQTTGAGDTDVRFSGNADAVYKADVDTYYAIYPSKEFSNGEVTFDLTTQDGTAAKAAILAAKAENAAKGVIDMSFSPINALLHVAVSGNTAQIMKAEFLAYNGAKLPKGFTYNFTDGSVATAGEVASYVIETPDAEGFFFSLPADLDMSEGYIVRLTDNDGKVCSKAYKGKTFVQGTTTRVNVEWSQPSVTLGTPMTSYSYYAQGKASQANNCANNVIYFPNASSFAGVQKAMVTEAGVIVDGKEYKVDAVAKSFTPANVTVSTWGSHTVQAYIKTEGKTITSAPQTVHITGLPHKNHWFSSNDTTGWQTTGSVSFDSKYGYCTWHYYKVPPFSPTHNKAGAIFSPSFNLPANVNIHYDIKACYCTGGSSGSADIQFITGITSGTAVPSSTQTKTLSLITSNEYPKEANYTTFSFDATIGNSQRIYITDSHDQDFNYINLYVYTGSCNVMYR